MTIEMQAVQVFAPAKINLSLKILGRRDDGFHEIETLITPIGLCDEIKIKKNEGGIEFHCDDPSVPKGDDNLAIRAAQAFVAATKLKPAVSIELKKKIPHGAGLGGGSSDAATTLLALNELFETKLSAEALAKMAGAIGSDVPFFIFQSAAMCKGRGERVTPIQLQKELPILLLKPDFFINHLERPVFEKFVFLARLKMWLLKQPEVEVALMSGSGATVFAVLRNKRDAEAIAERASDRLDPDLWTCACETL